MERADRGADAHGGSLRISRRARPAKMAMMTKPEATSKTRQMRRRSRIATGSVCAALARREVNGNAAQQLQGKRGSPTLPRTQWALSSVLQREENLVLLGFSSDGHFLLYYSWWESCYELQWKQVQFSSRSGKFVSHRACFRLPVGADTAAFGEHDNSASSLANGVGSALKVWQSCDDALVVAFGTDRQQLTSQESSQIYYVSVAPSPSYAGTHPASDISSLRFVYTVQSPCQEPGSWQLLQVSPREHRNTYHFVVNMGTSVMILVFAIVRKYDKSGDCSKSSGAMDHEVAAPFSGARGSLGVHHFAQNAWYATPEFPVEFQAEEFHKQPRSNDKTNAYSIAIECVCQQKFEVEAFLQSFLSKYASLRELNLVDYDLQLVRASEMESALFMSCVMELESSTLVLGGNSTSRTHRHIVMALFFSLDIKTGEYTVIRALKLPRQQNLRQLSKSMTYKYKVDINRRVPPSDAPATWSNATVVQEQSLLYSNESYTTGGVGYFGRSGLYTTHDFVVSSLDASKHSPIIYADYWKNYKYDEDLLKSVPVSSLRNNAKYFPPAEVGCADDSGFGCKNHCSRTKACTDRENQGGGKECIVVIMMYDYYDPGYLQAVLANNDIPAYFCFIGYEGAQNYALDAQKSGQPMLFYHFEPDLFHFNYPGLFDRVFLPRSVPERVVLATGTFGESGYGEKTNNPVDVDFPTTTLTKYAASLVINQQIGPLLSKFSLSDLSINAMLRKYLAASSDPAEPDPSFRAACNWVKENYAVWNLWLDRLPLCAFESHVKYEVTGCENGSVARTISFEWRHPNPVNLSLPYDCDGGVAQLPDAIVTSRSCEWILQDDRRWIDWTTAKPTCDASFYKYNITGCDSASKRTVQYFWLLGDPFDPTKSAECEGGGALPANVQIDCEHMPFSSSIFLAMAAIATVIALTLVVAMIFVYRHRRAPIIKRSQFELLELMIFGGLLVCGAAVVYAGKPSDLLCALRPVLVSTGFTTIFGALVVKSLRVYRVFMRSSMKRVTMTMKKMLKFLSIFCVVDVIIFAAWFGVAFPKPTTAIEAAVEFQGQVDRIQCESSSFIFTALLIFWKAILLFLGLYISFLIRNVSSDFQESTWIFASAMVVLVGSLVILPLGYLVKMAAAPFYVFLACPFPVCTGLIMGFMLVPKLFRFNEMPRISDATKNTTNFGDRRGSGGVGASKYDDDSTNIGTTQSNHIKPKAKYTVAPLHRHASM